MYRPYSRFGILVKALTGASVAASWPGMLALPFAFYAPNLLLIPLIVFATAFGHGAVLGLPLYLVLKRRGWANGWLAALAGVCIGMMPVLLFMAIRYVYSPSDFQPRPYGADWLTEMRGALWMFGFLGLCGGLNFFAIVSGDSAED